MKLYVRRNSKPGDLVIKFGGTFRWDHTLGGIRCRVRLDKAYYLNPDVADYDQGGRAWPHLTDCRTVIGRPKP